MSLNKWVFNSVNWIRWYTNIKNWFLKYWNSTDSILVKFVEFFHKVFDSVHALFDAVIKQLGSVRGTIVIVVALVLVYDLIKNGAILMQTILHLFVDILIKGIGITGWQTVVVVGLVCASVTLISIFKKK